MTPEETTARYTLEEKRDWALAGIAHWESHLAVANVAADRAHEMGGGIPGFGGSGNQRAAKQVRSAHQSADRKWREATDKLEYYSEKLKGYERRMAERDRTLLTLEDIKDAKWVRASTGWRRVVRVNAKSVSVDSGYSWTDRIPLAKILEVRGV